MQLKIFNYIFFQAGPKHLKETNILGIFVVPFFWPSAIWVLFIRNPNKGREERERFA
jgi:hypothetical protein